MYISQISSEKNQWKYWELIHTSLASTLPLNNYKQYNIWAQIVTNEKIQRCDKENDGSIECWGRALLMSKIKAIPEESEEAAIKVGVALS